MQLEAFLMRFNQFVKSNQPFLFIIDFECKQPYLCKLEEAAHEHVFFNIKGYHNLEPQNIMREIVFESIPVSKEIYAGRFNNILYHLNRGDTYLLNLTFPAQIKCNLSLSDIFHVAEAPYKLLFKDKFVLFSPESFIRIRDGEIFTFPMKGTIDGSRANAEQLLMNNPKEEWEHNTIVDLMRNDLAMIAGQVTLEKYRYIEKIKTHRGELLQTSSEIRGKLKKNYRDTLGSDIMKLLPAGSISGAPKKRTVELITKNEIASRGYYTGIFGIFNGSEIDSAVNIRFIECCNGELFFRSGGGITSSSNLDDEYEELLQKICLPVGQTALKS
ncbi:MAG: aminodeoxychorismate synthase component I [Bacteroidia bacterium]|nr:aminodeoxychorismate synthase component I [Bacteroidia bacterium]MCZ2278529.1 aminodeoxychorismate synthase component I [Bacteroidia bacterium]